MMKTKLTFKLLCFCLLPSAFCLRAPGQGTAFDYQGRLTDGGVPATGLYDVRFILYNAELGGSQVGPILTNAPTPVTNGLFTVNLNFGAGIFDGTAYWLEIAVRTNSSVSLHTVLSPRQALAPVPYALFAPAAGTAGSVPWSALTQIPPGFADGVDDNTLYSAGPGLVLNGTQFSVNFSGNGSANTASRGDHQHDSVYAALGHTHSAADLVSGTLPNARLTGAYSSALTLNNSANHFAGDGSELTGLNAFQLVSGVIADARLSANVALLNTNQIFSGSNIFSGVVCATNAAGKFAGTFDGRFSGLFEGNGSSVSNLSAANLVGSLPDAQLSPNIPRLNANQTFSGTVRFSPPSGAPFAVGSTVKVTSLNADLIDGLDSTSLALTNHNHDSSYWRFTGNSGTTPGAQFLGTTDDQALELKVNGARALRIEPGGSPNLLGGFTGNSVGAGIVGATIGGGGTNGLVNAVTASYGTVAGGLGNTVEEIHGAVGGGRNNSIQVNARNATISGGINNTIENGANTASIGGGSGNTIASNALTGTISGGMNNAVQTAANTSTIAGGSFNTIESNAVTATIGGGLNNVVRTNAGYATIAGGKDNSVTGDSPTVGGGRDNQAEGISPTIAGGNSNVASGDYSTVGGGTNNAIGARASSSTISGGRNNLIETNAAANTIGGGNGNAIQHFSSGATIGGGQFNAMQIGASQSTIAGGIQNTVESAANNATIGGGNGNTIAFGGDDSTISGGVNNRIGTNSIAAAIAGGDDNEILTGSSHAFIGGGFRNTVGTNAYYGTIPGGLDNVAAGELSFAAGYRAKANHDGAFVWSDFTLGENITSTNANSMTFRARGGVRFYSNSNLTAGVFLAPSGSSWASISDREAKKNFQPVDNQAILAKLAAVPIQRWNYKWEPDESVPHLGPVAQDFKAAFYPGRDDKSITTMEFDGVALAAIQGLNQKLSEELKRRDAENAALKARLEELERIMLKPQAN